LALGLGVSLSLGFGLLGLQTGCGKDDGGKETQAKLAIIPPSILPAGAARGSVAGGDGDKAEGLVIRLEPGQSPDAGGGRAKVAQGKPLSAAATRALLARAKPVGAKASDVKTFAFRKRSLPPPRTGKTVEHVFPPPAATRSKPPAGAGGSGSGKGGGALKVLRVSPSGAVKMAPKLSVTFSQPMVAVTSHKDTLAQGVPVTLKPTLEGTWRWIGTKTLLFETEHRFPMATLFTAKVPAGTKSKHGKKLSEAKEWSFSTPPPRLLGRYPTGGPHRLDPMLLASFDQRIDPAAVLETIRLEGGGRKWPLRAATAAEIAAHEKLRRFLRQAKSRVKKRGPRWVAFVPEKPLAPATTYTVSVGPGTPSAEGPRKTTETQTFEFKTYAPLEVKWSSCRVTRQCRPPRGLSIRFNNPLDEKQLETKDIARQIRVSPAIGDMRIVARGRYLRVYGRTKGNTIYTVRLPASLPDAFGQTLGKAQEIKFAFQEARPALMGQYKKLTVLDPSADPAVRVFSINHDKLRVRVWKVKPSDWETYLKWRRKFQWRRKFRYAKEPPPQPGTLAKTWTLDVKGGQDELVETTVPLDPFLNAKGHGQLVVQVSQWPLPDKKHRRHYVTTWIQATHLAVDAMVDHRHLHAWVSRLADGSSVKGARVAVLSAGAKGTTGAKGMARIRLPASAASAKAVLVARTRDDLVMLPESRYRWGRSYWYRRAAPGEQVRWFVFDDRKLYKPKEKVRLKGWVRAVDMGATGGIRLLSADDSKVAWTVKGPRGNKLGNGTAALNPMGGFHLEFDLPDDVNLGRARVELRLMGPRSGSTRHRFRIQEFKRPEFEVAAEASPGPHVVGGHADVAVTARYYAGGGLPGAKVSWSAATARAHYTPPNWRGWSFGGSGSRWGRKVRGVKTQRKTHEGVTDGDGKDRLRIHFDRVEPAVPMRVKVSATVHDVSRRTWTADKSLLVHPARRTVGLRTQRYFVKKGTPLKVQVIVTDLEGKAQVGPLAAVQAVRLAWRHEGGKWRRKEMDAQDCRVAGKTKAQTCTFETKKGGRYLIRARVSDAQGRPSRTVITRYVSGGRLPPVRKVKKEKVRIIESAERYQPGDTAKLLVLAPFAPAEGVLTVRRAGILLRRRFSMRSTSTTLELPITKEHYPGLRVQVDLAGSAPRLDRRGEPDPKLPRRPAYASGSTSLSVPPLARKLKVAVTPRPDKVVPGGHTAIDVSLRDAAGQPVAGAEVALVAVDEAVLALTGYKLSSPLSTFHPWRSAGVRDHYLRRYVKLMDPLKLAEAMRGEGRADTAVQRRAPGAKAGLGSALPQPAPSRGLRRRSAKRAPKKKMAKLAKAEKKTGDDAPSGPRIRVRKDLTPLAVFAPAVTTDARGRAQVKVKLPDNLTRYRVMAVAVAKATHYGYGEAHVVAQQPLMLRPQPPRFLNFGDRFAFPVVIQNQSNEKLAVQVAVRGTNVKWTGARGRQVRVPANDRREVRFPARAADPGTARLQVVAASGSWADAAERELPVWTPATTEAFATYGTVDQGAAIQPVQMPKGVIKEFGGLRVSTSSTALHALTDAVVYLYKYPYGCSEQIASRILSIAALRDVLEAFDAPGLPPKAKLEAAVGRDLRRLRYMQNPDGGWGFWRRYNRSWPFLSVHVTHALVRAKEKGFTVPPPMLRQGLGYLKQIERHIPSSYGERIRRVIVAYSLYVRQHAGDGDVDKAKSLYKKLAGGKAPPLEAIAWIYPVLSGRPEATTAIAEIRRDLKNRVTETAGAAHFRTSYSDGGHLILHSDRRIDGLLLEGLIKDQPRSELIPKIVRGLLAHRKKGRWANTQETVWVLLALDRYFNTYEKTTPNFVARIWLGERYAGQHRYAGRSTDRHQVSIPMRMLGEVGQSQKLVLDKQGPGRLYYRVGLRYAPTDLKPPPADHGFTVQRRYEATDDPKDVIRLPDGTWQVRAGARVRVVVTMVAEARRYHVALVDPLPAGLEPINPALRGGQQTPGKMSAKRTRSSRSNRIRRPRRRRVRASGRRGLAYRYWGWRRRAWFVHQNLRDERAEAFTSYLPAGVYTYRYTARAITPGTFVVPPPKAEEMYHPETFGRGAGDKLVVK